MNMHRPGQKIKRILILTGGELAENIFKSAQELMIESVAIESDTSDLEKILKVADEFKVDAIYPGPGRFASDPSFAEEVENRGIIFIGPTPDSLRIVCDQHATRELASELGIKVFALTQSTTEIKVQVISDGKGNHFHLFEVEYQKNSATATAPSPSLTALRPEVRLHIHAAAIRLITSINYRGVGQVIFELSLEEGGTFCFKEIVPLLSPEYKMIEKILGIDLIGWQLKVAEGEELPWKQREILQELSGSATITLPEFFHTPPQVREQGFTNFRNV
ncbi:MAG: hypothetical protein HQK50_11590 [Oligoflexia bacterium]|nr:hypothetical protein [Oligoflexia bacterium]